MLLVRVVSGAVINGRIVEDHSGQPIIAAEVRIRQVGARILTADLETDSDGKFETPDIPDADYRIEISKTNFSTATFDRRVQGAASISVRLVRGAAVMGRVFDAEGKPIGAVSVFAMSRGSVQGPLKRNMNPGRFATTDANGQYRLYNLPPGRYVVVASYGASTTAIGSSGSVSTPSAIGSGFLFYPDNARPRIFEFSGGEENRDIDFRIQASSFHSVSGKLEHPEGKGSYWLALAPVEQAAMATAIAQSKPDGNFRFENVPAGSYHLFVSGPSIARNSMGAVLGKESYFARARVDLAQNVEGLTITVGKGRSATFQLTADPRAKLDPSCAKGAKLTLVSNEDWGANLERALPIEIAKTHTFDSLAPARYMATLSDLSGCHATEIAVDLTGGSANASITIPLVSAGSIQGTIGKTAASVAVGLLPVEGTGSVRIANPDSEGRFEFTSLAPGRYRVWAQPSGGSPASEVEVHGGAVASVDLSAAGKVSR